MGATVWDKTTRRSGGLRVWRAAADEGLARAIEGGGADYDRARALPRLIGFDPKSLARGRDEADVGRAIRARLTRALRAERRRGRAGHWTYDLNRHLALLQALAGEEAIAGRRPSAPNRAGSSEAAGRNAKTPPGEAGRRFKRS